MALFSKEGWKQIKRKSTLAPSIQSFQAAPLLLLLINYWCALLSDFSEKNKGILFGLTLFNWRTAGKGTAAGPAAERQQQLRAAAGAENILLIIYYGRRPASAKLDHQKFSGHFFPNRIKFVFVTKVKAIKLKTKTREVCGVQNIQVSFQNLKFRGPTGILGHSFQNVVQKRGGVPIFT